MSKRGFWGMSRHPHTTEDSNTASISHSSSEPVDSLACHVCLSHRTTHLLPAATFIPASITGCLIFNNSVSAVFNEDMMTVYTQPTGMRPQRP